MGNDVKVARLLAPKVPLVLEVEGDNNQKLRLSLDLVWNMRAVITIESYLRAKYAQEINILQTPGDFWKGMDCTKLALGVWACSMQEQPQYADEEGFETIASFLTADNYVKAMDALRNAYLESLSPKRREELLKAVEEAKKKNQEKDPTSAQTPA